VIEGVLEMMLEAIARHEDRTKSIVSQPQAFLAYVDTSFMEKIFGIPQKRGYLTYIGTEIWMILGDVLKWRNGKWDIT